MPLYYYVKNADDGGRKRKPVWISYLLMSIGVAILIWVTSPILLFNIVTSGYITSKPITPIQNEQQVVSGGLVDSVLAATSDQATNADFTNANLWFPTKPQKKIVGIGQSYGITIPKLEIDDARVLVGTDDLNKSLIHYGGTPMPGDYGNAVVFGHSTLPQFFDPSNYKSIFSTLPTLKKGDDFFVEYDGVSYKYRVYEMTVTEPNDLTPLEQRYDDSYITLITCVPPGTYWKRLNVRAILIRPS